MDKRNLGAAYLSIFALLLSACSSNAATSADAPSLAPPLASSTRDIQSPKLTDEPSVPKIFVIADPNMHLQIQQFLLSDLQDLVATQGWILEQHSSFPADNIDPQLRVVVVLPPAPSIEQWADQTPEVQFVAIGISDLGTKPNLSLIGPNGFREDQLSFLAGYLAAVITLDWRIAIIVDQAAEVRAAGFRNGMIYYCGLCRLTYPPFNDYPISFTLRADHAEEDWKQAADFFTANAVDTLFVNVNARDTEMMEILMNSGLNMFGNTMPAETSQWIATLRLAPEISLLEKWDAILQENGGWRTEIPLLVEDVNQELLSIGRLQSIEKMIVDLQAGFIDPSVTPISPD